MDRDLFRTVAFLFEWSGAGVVTVSINQIAQEAVVPDAAVRSTLVSLGWSGATSAPVDLCTVDGNQPFDLQLQAPGLVDAILEEFTYERPPR